jgi:predicted SprT family Zn-dependent metalloprotease
MPPIRRTSNVSIAKNDSRYVYECPNCERKFYRKKRNSKLNPHKDKDGLACSGRRGILIN